MKKRVDSKIYMEWFIKGNHDLSSAEIIYREEGFTDTICFLCQQSAEKYLKGYLLARKVRPDKVHDLVKLVNQCRKIKENFDELLEEANFLNVFYIETRYPPDSPIIYPRPIAKKALEATKKILKFVTEEIKNDQ